MQTGEVTDMCIEHGTQPALWIATKNAWYKLLQPTHEYFPAYAPAIKRAVLCTRASVAMQRLPEGSFEQLLALILPAGAGGGNSSMTFTQAEMQAEANYLCEHLEAWAKVGALRLKWGPWAPELHGCARSQVLQGRSPARSCVYLPCQSIHNMFVLCFRPQ